MAKNDMDRNQEKTKQAQDVYGQETLREGEHGPMKADSNTEPAVGKFSAKGKAESDAPVDEVYAGKVKPTGAEDGYENAGLREGEHGPMKADSNTEPAVGKFSAKGKAESDAPVDEVYAGKVKPTGAEDGYENAGLREGEHGPMKADSNTQPLGDKKLAQDNARTVNRNRAPEKDTESDTDEIRRELDKERAEEAREEAVKERKERMDSVDTDEIMREKEREKSSMNPILLVVLVAIVAFIVYKFFVK